MERFTHGGDIYSHPGVVDFSASLNPLGMPQAARDALARCIDECAYYPDPHCYQLTRSIARFEGVDERMVLACAGATDAFMRICLAVRPSRALVCAPSYVGYAQVLEQVGATVVEVPLLSEDDFAVDHRFVNALDSSLDLVFIAHPNNPTGRCVDGDTLRALLARAEHLGIYVVLDECFIDLTEQYGTAVDLLVRFNNLVVVKALTKTFALAGLRVGYALSANQELLERLRFVGQPWSVSVPGQVAGVACLDDPWDYLAQSRELIARERTRLAEALGALGCRIVPSSANFILWHAQAGLSQKFLSEKILVRSCDNFAGLDECWYRSAVRTPQENGLFIQALKKVMA